MAQRKLLLKLATTQSVKSPAVDICWDIVIELFEQPWPVGPMLDATIESLKNGASIGFSNVVFGFAVDGSLLCSGHMSEQCCCDVSDMIVDLEELQRRYREATK